MMKRNASSGSRRSTARKRDKAAGPARSVKVAAARKGPVAAKVPALPVKPGAGKVPAKKLATEKTTAGKVAAKSAAIKKSAVKTRGPRKSAAAKQTTKAVKTSARGISAGHVKTTAGKAAAVAIMLEQVEGWAVVDVVDGIAVHDPHFKRVHYLNHTGAAIYLLCKEPISLSVIITILREEFGLDRDPGSEIQRTVEDMMRIGLIRRAGKRR